MKKSNKEKSYLIIQPHSDDALFSVGHLVLSEHNVSILTVENNAKRISEDEKLYQFIGKNWNHLDVDFDDQSFYEFYKHNKDLNESNGHDFMISYFGEEKMSKIKNAVNKFVEKFVSQNEDSIIYLPWGIGHPFHLFIRICVERKFANKDGVRLRFYRDFPHSYKRRAQAQVAEQLHDFVLYKSYDVKDFADIKWELAKKFYKSQSGLLWFEQGYIKKNLPEEVYVRKPS